jgi:hypothetical protein
MFQCTRVKQREGSTEGADHLLFQCRPASVTLRSGEAAVVVVYIRDRENPWTTLSYGGNSDLAAGDPVSSPFPARLTGRHLQMHRTLLSVCRAPCNAVPHRVAVNAAVSAMAAAEISLK